MEFRKLYEKALIADRSFVPRSEEK